MKKCEAKAILGELAKYWPKLPDQQKQAAWDSFTKNEKNAVYTLWGVDGLPLAVQEELATKDAPETTTIEVPVVVPEPESVSAPLLAELTVYDKLALRPVVYPLWARLDSMVKEPEPVMEPVAAVDLVLEPEPVFELPPELLESLGKMTVEEAELVKDINLGWAQMLFYCVVIICGAYVVYLVLCL